MSDMGGSVFACFMLLGTIAMTLLGYATGYMDGQEREDKRSEKKHRNSRDTRRDKPIDFDLRSRK